MTKNYSTSVSCEIKDGFTDTSTTIVLDDFP